MECKQILTIVDFSENTGQIIDYTLELAKKENASVCLLHPSPPQSGYAYYSPKGVNFYGSISFGNFMIADSEVESIAIKKDTQALELLKEKVEKQGIEVSIKLLQGDSVSNIVKEAKIIKADLIIIGGHQQGFFADLVLGNPEKALIKKSPCPVLIIPEKSK